MIFPKRSVFVLGATVILAGCTTTATTQPDSKNITPSPTAMTYKTMSELMKAGKSLHCTWTSTDDKGETDGDVYADGKKFASTIVMKSGDAVTTGSAISDGSWVYSWSSAMPGKGMKFNLDQISSDTAKPSGAAADLNKPLDYKCDTWAADASKFELPKDVTFSDTTGLINNANSQTNTSSACNACNMIPDAMAKAQCLKAANCK